MNKYPIAEPSFSELEKKYVNDCLDTGWISSVGGYVEKFEKAYAKFNNTKFAISVSNGTVSLHLILLSLEIGRGDEVIVPNFTYVAAVNSVLYVGARPVLVECNFQTYNIDTTKIEEKITKKTKAIIAVHLYGNPCEMDKLQKIAKKYNLYIVEDAAEAHGALFKNKMVGSFGIANSFSFFGNKTITTGEGGMITTNSKKIYEIIKLLKNQGQHPKDKKYYHRILGYNYRLTNLQAAIGLAQLTKIKKFLKKKKQINKWYKKFLHPAVKKDIVKFQEDTAFSQPSYWMNAVTINIISLKKLSIALKKSEIITRPFFTPMHLLPYINNKETFFISEKLYSKGIILPSGVNLTEEDVKKISKILLKNI